MQSADIVDFLDESGQVGTDAHYGAAAEKGAVAKYLVKRRSTPQESILALRLFIAQELAPDLLSLAFEHLFKGL